MLLEQGAIYTKLSGAPPWSSSPGPKHSQPRREPVTIRFSIPRDVARKGPPKKSSPQAAPAGSTRRAEIGGGPLRPLPGRMRPKAACDQKRAGNQACGYIVGGDASRSFRQTEPAARKGPKGGNSAAGPLPLSCSDGCQQLAEDVGRRQRPPPSFLWIPAPRDRRRRWVGGCGPVGLRACVQPSRPAAYRQENPLDLRRPLLSSGSGSGAIGAASGPRASTTDDATSPGNGTAGGAGRRSDRRFFWWRCFQWGRTSGPWATRPARSAAVGPNCGRSGGGTPPGRREPATRPWSAEDISARISEDVEAGIAARCSREIASLQAEQRRGRRRAGRSAASANASRRTGSHDRRARRWRFA